MKAAITTMIGGFSGKLDGLVYYYNKRLQRFIVRKAPRFTPSEHTMQIGRITKNLGKLCPSEAYKQDMNIYSALLRADRNHRNLNILTWYNLFVKLMWNMKKSLGTDLETITIASIYAENLPCTSLKTAVEAGLLPELSGYEQFTNQI